MKKETFTASGKRVGDNVWHTTFDKPITVGSGDFVMGHLTIDDDRVTECFTVYRKGEWIPASSPPPYSAEVLVVVDVNGYKEVTTATYRTGVGTKNYCGWYHRDNPWPMDNEDMTAKFWQPFPSI